MIFFFFFFLHESHRHVYRCVRMCAFVYDFGTNMRLCCFPLFFFFMFFRFFSCLEFNFDYCFSFLGIFVRICRVFGWSLAITARRSRGQVMCSCWLWLLLTFVLNFFRNFYLMWFDIKMEFRLQLQYLPVLSMNCY